jgi:MOSC domain-containing protein YiiM
MRVISVNVSQTRPINLGGHEIMTGIFKRPVQGRIAVRRSNLDGDAQADLTVHGGEYKAVYAYPEEHYPYWEQALHRRGLAPGMFGENLTTSGLLEKEVCVGDTYRIGSAVLQVTQPRTPCAKLAHKFARPQLLKEFLLSGKSGFYFRVVQEGDLAAGDEVILLQRDPCQVTVRNVLGLTDLKEFDPELASRALKVQALAPEWREELAALVKN